jgi:hypothetical protein
MSLYYANQEANDRLDDAHRYGFRWGPISVVRTATLARHRVLTISMDGNDKPLEIYVSNTGRSVRVFRDGKEMS